MSIKGQTRARPYIEANREHIKRDEHLLCATTGCRNVIAFWATRVRPLICSRCRRQK